MSPPPTLADATSLDTTAADADRVRHALSALRAQNAEVAELLGPGEIDVELDPRCDYFGDPGLFIVVYLPDDTPDDRLRGEVLGPIHMAAFDAVWDHSRERWPYIEYSKRSEHYVSDDVPE